jgi:hypothetical protein
MSSRVKTATTTVKEAITDLYLAIARDIYKDKEGSESITPRTRQVAADLVEWMRLSEARQIIKERRDRI